MGEPLSARDLLDLALINSGEFRECLAETAQAVGGGATGITAQLIQEANDCALRGEIADARCLLDRAVNPKWASSFECQRAYEAAMAEQRGDAA